MTSCGEDNYNCDDMAKKVEKTADNKIIENNESYEKLRDELFNYRVEIQSYKRSMSTLWACVPIIVAIFGFFGYNRVESLLEDVEKNAYDRLSKTDSLLSRIDAHFLDSLMSCVEERTVAYEEAIAALEKGTRVNNELYKKLISGLPYNTRREDPINPFVIKDATNLFDIVFYSDNYSYGETGECYIVMGDEYVKDKDDLFLVQITPMDRNVAVYFQTFEIQNNYNKLYFKFGKFQQYNDYLLTVVLLRRNGKETLGYRLSKTITAK